MVVEYGMEWYIESRRSAKEEDEFFVDYVDGGVGKLGGLE